MCKDPEILQPLKGYKEPNSVLQAIKPGISASANSISSRPKSAKAVSKQFIRQKGLKTDCMNKKIYNKGFSC